MFKHAGDVDTAGMWELTGGILRETAKAILFDDAEGNEPQWLPKSKIKIERTPGREAVVVFVPEWLAREKGYV